PLSEGPPCRRCHPRRPVVACRPCGYPRGSRPRDTRDGPPPPWPWSPDQDDVPFLELEDLHDLGVDPDDPSTCVRGFRLRDAQKFLTTGRHGDQTPEPSVDADRRPGRRIGSGLLEIMWIPA